MAPESRTARFISNGRDQAFTTGALQLPTTGLESRLPSCRCREKDISGSGPTRRRPVLGISRSNLRNLGRFPGPVTSAVCPSRLDAQHSAVSAHHTHALLYMYSTEPWPFLIGNRIPEASRGASQVPHLPPYRRGGLFKVVLSSPGGLAENCSCTKRFPIRFLGPFAFPFGSPQDHLSGRRNTPCLIAISPPSFVSTFSTLFNSTAAFRPVRHTSSSPRLRWVARH